MQREANTEQAILESARKVFNRKGLDGTSVQDIADDAGTTKSMVNYYFRSKEKLFAAVFRAEFKNFFGNIISVLDADIPLYDKICAIVQMDIDKISRFPQMPIFVVNEINRNPEIVFADTGDGKPFKGMLVKLGKQIDKEARKGIIKKVRPIDLIVNIQALTVFPFLAKPLMIKSLGMTEEEYQKRMRERYTQIVDIIWNYLKAR